MAPVGAPTAVVAVAGDAAGAATRGKPGEAAGSQAQAAQQPQQPQQAQQQAVVPRSARQPESPQAQQQRQRAGPGGPNDVASIFKDPVWAEVYAACCCDAREAPSMEAARGFRDALLAQNPDTRPQRLSLRGLRIGPTTVSCLGLQLKDRGYTRLDLSENMLGDHAALAVRSLVRALPRLRQLYVAGNLITAEGAQELAEELEANSTLEMLALGGAAEPGALSRGFRPNVIGSEGLRPLLGALGRNPKPALTSLNLCQTSLGAEAGRHLAAFLEHDRTLLNLDVSCNPLSSEGVCALLPQCTRLRILDIADTACRGELIHPQLASLLQRTTSLTRLSLANNPLETRPLRRISRGVVACTSLVSLSLEATCMGTEGVTVLVEAMLAAPVQSLTELNVSANNLSQVEAATSLAHAIAKYTTLQILRLGQNALGDAGVLELAEALDPKVCPGSSLQILDLGRCRVGTTGAGHLFACLKDNETLRVLRLGDNFLDDTLDMALIDQLTNVHELQLAGNRLSHAALQRAAQVAARNRQQARDEEPQALRIEMHRLLFQETKLGLAREQVDRDEAEVAARQLATDTAHRELQHLRTTEAESQRQLSYKIDNEEIELGQRRELSRQLTRGLEESARKYAERQHDLREKLKEREHALTDLQVKSDQVDRHLEQRRREHPEDVDGINARVKAALEEAAQLQDQARGMREQLKKLQDKSLIDFKP